MPQHPYGAEDYDDDLAAALNFSATEDSVADPDGGEQSAAWDFSVTEEARDDDDTENLSATEGFVADPDGGEQSAAWDFSGGEEAQDDEDPVPMFTVTNPPGTVSVSALMDGGIDKVGLSANATTMTESQLEEEILVIAQLARQKGQAAQHTFLLEGMRELGADDTEALRDLLENGMDLSSPEQAAQTQAQVFATRYQADK